MIEFCAFTHIVITGVLDVQREHLVRWAWWAVWPYQVDQVMRERDEFGRLWLERLLYAIGIRYDGVRQSKEGRAE